MNHRIAAVVFVVGLVACAADRAAAADMQGSLSIVALDRATGTIGIALVSDAPACGAEVPWLEAGVGAVATQGDVDPSWGPRALGLLRRGVAPQAVVDSLHRGDPASMRRQVGVLSAADGTTGGFTGLELVGFAAGVIDSFLAVQGNSLSYTTALVAVHDTMVARAAMPLPERLLHAIAWGATRARGPLRSAALLVGRPDPARPHAATRWISLRVDDHRAPVSELLRLYRLESATRLVESHLHHAALARRSGGDGKADEARAARLLAAALADTSLPASALNAMAWGMARHGWRLEDASRVVARALAREPRNRSALDTAAEVALKRGDRRAALEFARRAAAAAPRDEHLHARVKTLEGTAARP